MKFYYVPPNGTYGARLYVSYDLATKDPEIIEKLNEMSMWRKYDEYKPNRYFRWEFYHDWPGTSLDEAMLLLQKHGGEQIPRDRYDEVIQEPRF